jgi:hypothetical protein
LVLAAVRLVSTGVTAMLGETRRFISVIISSLLLEVVEDGRDGRVGRR